MMTLDKFGRHLVKNPQLVLTKFSDKEILSSSYMFYNVILKFEANAIVDNKYIIGFDRVDYKFPLEQGTIEKILLNNEEVLISLNDKLFIKEQALNYQMQFGTSISFVVKQSTSKTKNNKFKCLFAQIIVKCPIKFENQSVNDEKAIIKH
jgi:hypothetical protein